jgi:hypothetical protein
LDLPCTPLLSSWLTSSPSSCTAHTLPFVYMLV